MSEDRPGDGAEGGAPDHRYFGPFGQGSAADEQTEVLRPDQSGTWPAPDDYWAPGGDQSAPPAQTALWPAPSGYDPVTASQTAAGSARRPPRRGLRTGGVVAVAALTALIIGGGAGYGGARLAGTGLAPSAGASASPSAWPSATRSAVPPAPGTLDTVAVARQVLPGTVMLRVGGGTGSGFVIDREGWIITNNHVVADAAGGTAIRVSFSDGRRQTAKLIGRSPSYDIAVVKVDASEALQPIAVGDSDTIEVGAPVIAVGSPLGLPGTVTQGIVSAQNRPVVVTEDADADTPSAYIDAIQTDAPINPGNSGGPLIDAGARVIGVNSAILTLGASRGQSGSIGLGFAIPINQAMTITDELIKKGRATYPVIGASVQDGDGGVELKAVDSGGPAATAGLQVGDVITEIDRKPVEAMEELIVAIRTRRPGDVVVLDYKRGSTSNQVRVTLGSKEG